MRGKDTESVSFWCCWVERGKKVRKKKKKMGKSMALLQRAMSAETGREKRNWVMRGWRSGAVRIYTPLEWGGKEQINAKRRKNYKKAYAFS